MAKLLTILLLLIINVSCASALLFPASIVDNKKNLPLAAAKETDFQEVKVSQEILIETADASALGESTTSATAATVARSKINNLATPKKMKSNNIRWAVHGIVTELFQNIFLRTLRQVRTRIFASKEQRLEIQNCQRYRQSPKHLIAVVTGATGGIGSQIAHDLAFRGYDVVIAARDAVRGDALVKEIQGLLKVTPVKEKRESSSEGDLPTISFVEYHADVPQSALDLASSIEDLGSPVSLLINNAGIMGKSKQLTMKVNLVGPAMLTFILLPLMAKSTTPSTVINVGSSAHLRATYVIDGESLTSGDSNGNKQSYIDTLPDIEDDDLSTYAQSKLALMQFSTLLRHWLPKDNPPIQIVDAHPGLVWTPLLRNHIGDKAVRTLTKSGLAKLIYKSSSEGAQALVSALDSASLTTSSKEQVYFSNGQPGGYASSESASFDASFQLWTYVIAPEVEGVVDLPEGWGLDR
eukprot:CAMPEP_0172307738 /NCGR_PEP_ID=MMETSP1058-20130122/8518_1 /TAXON_ID=83371 /ORGANISM="Detonula confervacea, Strain CCMP 353" /LENGTH=466 /DNA_ID=CAMNT_0013019981 /DNA_START=21 /DNA_END=1421 /DNA_ORIENTATION=+